MPSRIKLRRDTSTNWWNNNPTLADGEPGYETDTGRLKIGKDLPLTWRNLDYVSSGTSSSIITPTRISTYTFNLDNELTLYLIGSNITGTADVKIMNGIDSFFNTQISPSGTGTYTITLSSGKYFTTDTNYTIEIIDNLTSSLYLWDVITYSPPPSFPTNFQVTVEPKTCSPKSIALTYTYSGPAVDVKFLVYTAGDTLLHQTDFITISRNTAISPTPTTYFIQSPTNFPIGINCRVAMYKRNGGQLYQSTDVAINGISVSNLYVVDSDSFNVDVSNVSSYLITEARITLNGSLTWDLQPSPPATVLSTIPTPNNLTGARTFTPNTATAYNFIITFQDNTTLETSFRYDRTITEFQPQIITNNAFNVYAILLNTTSLTLRINTSGGTVATYTYSIGSTPTAFAVIGSNKYSFKSELQLLTSPLNFLYNTQYTFVLTSDDDSGIFSSKDASPVSRIVNSDTDISSFTNSPFLFSGNRATLQYHWKGPSYNNVNVRCLATATEGATGSPKTLTNGSSSVNITLPYSNEHTALETNLYTLTPFVNNQYHAIQFIIGSTTVTSGYTQYINKDLELIQFEGSRNTRITKKISSVAGDNNRVYLYMKILQNVEFYAGYLTDLYLEVAVAEDVVASPNERIVRFIRKDPITDVLDSRNFPSNTFSYAYGRTYRIGIKTSATDFLYSNALEYRFTSPSISNLSISNAGDLVDFDWTHGSFVNSSDTRIRYYLMVNNTADNYAAAIDTGLIELTYTTSSTATGTGLLITDASYTLPTSGGAIMTYTIAGTTGLTVNSTFIATALVPNELNQEGTITSIITNPSTSTSYNPTLLYNVGDVIIITGDSISQGYINIKSSYGVSPAATLFGVWSSGSNYSVGQVITFNNIVYQLTANGENVNTNPAIQTPAFYTRLGRALPVASYTAWVSGTNYAIGDAVSFGGVVYVLFADGETTDTNPSLQATKWVPQPTQITASTFWSVQRRVEVRVDTPIGLSSGLSMNRAFPGLSAIKTTTVSFKSDTSRRTNVTRGTATSSGTEILYQMTTTAGGEPTLALTPGQYVNISGFNTSGLNTSGRISRFFVASDGVVDRGRFYISATVTPSLSEVKDTAPIPIVRLILNPQGYYYIKAQHTGTAPIFTEPGIYDESESASVDICNSSGLNYYRAEIRGITVVYNSLTSATVTVQRGGQLAPYDLIIEQRAGSAATSGRIKDVSAQYQITDTTTPNVSTNVTLSGSNEFMISKYYRPLLEVSPASIPPFEFGLSTLEQYRYDLTVLNAASTISFSTYDSNSNSNGTRLYASFPYKGPTARVYFVLTDTSSPFGTILTSTPRILPNSPSSTVAINFIDEQLSATLGIGKTYTASLYFNTNVDNTDRFKLDFDSSKTYTYIPSSYTIAITNVTSNTVTATFSWFGPDIQTTLTARVKQGGSTLSLIDNTFNAGTSGNGTSYTFTLSGASTFVQGTLYELDVVALPDTRVEPPSAAFSFATLAYVPASGQTSLFRDISGGGPDNLGVAQVVGTVLCPSNVSANLTIELLKFVSGSSSVVSSQSYTVSTGTSITTTFLANLLDIGSTYNIRYRVTATGLTPPTPGFILASNEVYDPSGYDILVFAGQSNMAGVDNAGFYGSVVGENRVYIAKTSVIIPYEKGKPPQITDDETTETLQDLNAKNVKILKETARDASGNTTVYDIDDAKGPFRSSEATENTPPNNINIPYQFTSYYTKHTPSLVDPKRRVCVIVRPKSSSGFWTADEWVGTLRTRLIDAINYVRNLRTYEEGAGVTRLYTCNRIKVFCWLQGEADAPRIGSTWAMDYLRPMVCRVMTDTATPYNNAHFLLGNILSMHFQRFCDINYYFNFEGGILNPNTSFLALSRDIDRFSSITNIQKDDDNIARYKPRQVSSFGLHAIDENVPTGSIVSTSASDADSGASIHFSARSIRIYSRRFFNAFLDSIGRPSSERYSEPFRVSSPSTILYNSLTRNMIWNSTAISYRHTHNPVGYFISAVIGTNLTAESSLDNTASAKYAIISEYATDAVGAYTTVTTRPDSTTITTVEGPAVFVPNLQNLATNKFGVGLSATNARVVINGVTLSGVRFYPSTRSYLPVSGAMDITLDNKQVTSSIGTFLKNITDLTSSSKAWTELSHDSNLSLTLEPLVYSASSGTHSNDRSQIIALPPIVGLYHDSFITPLTGSTVPSLVDFSALPGWIGGIQTTRSILSSAATLASSGSRVIIAAGFEANGGYNSGTGSLITKSIRGETSSINYALVGTNVFSDTSTDIETFRPALSRDAFPYAVGLWNPGSGQAGANFSCGSGYLYNRVRGSLFDDILFFSAARIVTVSTTPSAVNNGGGVDNSQSYGYQYSIISQLGASTDPIGTVNLRTTLGISSSTIVPYFSLVNTGTAVALRIRNVLPNTSYILSYWFSVPNARVPYFNSNANSDPASMSSGGSHLYLTNYLPVTIRTANPSASDRIIYVTGVNVATNEIYISSVTGAPQLFSKVYFESSFNGISRFRTYYIYSVSNIYTNLFRVRLSDLPGDNERSLTGASTVGLSVKGKLQNPAATYTAKFGTFSPDGDIGINTITSSAPLVNNSSMVYINPAIEDTITSHLITNSSLSATRITYTVSTGHAYAVGQYLTITGNISGKLSTYNITNVRISTVTTTSFTVLASDGYTIGSTGTFEVKNVIAPGFYYIRDPEQTGATATIRISLTPGGAYIPFYKSFSKTATEELYTGLYSNAATEFLRAGYPSSGNDSTTEQRIHFSRGSDSSNGNQSDIYVHKNTAKSWTGQWTKLNLNFTTPDYTASDAFSSAYLQFGPLPMIRSTVVPLTLSIVTPLQATDTYVQYTTSTAHGLNTGDIIMSVSGFTSVHSQFNFSFEKPIKKISATSFQVANDFAFNGSGAYSSSTVPITGTLVGTGIIVTFMNPTPSSSQREFIATTFNFAGIELTVRR